MNFGQEVQQAETPTFGKKFAEARGYTVAIVGVEFVSAEENERYKNDTLILKVDIAEGDHAGEFADKPKWVFISLAGVDYWGKENAPQARKTIQTIVDENLGIFQEGEDVFNEDFDENRLIGCTVGCVFKWKKPDFKFIEPSYICSKQYASTKGVVKKPEIKVTTPAEDFTVEEQKPKSLFGKK